MYPNLSANNKVTKIDTYDTIYDCIVVAHI